MKKHIEVGLIILSCLGLIYFADIFLNPNSIADLGWNWYLDSEWYKMDSWLITNVVDLVLKVPFYVPLCLLVLHAFGSFAERSFQWDITPAICTIDDYEKQ